MSIRLHSTLLALIFCLALGVSRLANAQAVPAPAAVDTGSGDAAPVEQVMVTARLDQARSNLQPSLGAEVYSFGRGALRTIPQGNDTPLNQVLLQAPGVAQDSYV